MTHRSVLRFDREGVSLVLRGRPVSSVVISPGQNLSDRLTSWLAEQRPPGRRRRLVIELRPPWIQLRDIPGLPTVGHRDLGLLLAQAPAKFFRVTGPVRLAAVWVSGPESGARFVTAGAIDGGLFDALGAAVTSAGWTVSSVEAPARSGGGTLRFASGGAVVGGQGSQWVRRIRGVMAGALVLVLAGLSAAEVWGIREGHRLERELARILPTVVAVDRLQATVANAEAAAQAIGAARANRGAALAALAAVAHVLPDSAMLLSFETDGIRGRLTGRARRGMQTIATLEGQWPVPQRVEGTPVREPYLGGQWDRFAIEFGVRQ